MSELTTCNFCSLKDMKRNMPPGHRLVKRHNATWGMGGINIYVVPLDVEVPQVVVDGDEFHKAYWNRWFMELSTRCVC